MERFARAAEELLQDRPFEKISVLDIVRRAKRPIGSFYARFRGKDALLPHLYQRYHDGLEPYIIDRLARTDWSRLDFPATVGAIVDFTLGMYDERRWLIRALALFARTSPEALPDGLLESRRRVFDAEVQILLRHKERIPHKDPAAAARFGIFLVSSVAREKLLFGEAPHARVTPLSRKALRAEMVRALHGYLAQGVPQ
jgi:AcrR family transcriptional regulator